MPPCHIDMQLIVFNPFENEKFLRKNYIKVIHTNSWRIEVTSNGGDLPTGIIFVNERKPKRSLSLFFGRKKSGEKALFISRNQPETMAGGEELTGVECHRILLREEGDSVKPSDLRTIEGIITSFFQRNKGGVAFVDGVEMLTLFNEFTKVTEMLRKAQEAADSCGGFIVIPIDNRAIYPEDYRLISEKFKFLNPEGKE